MAASTGRPGDRTFFIYDHSATKKEDDDPKDAIIYFFPQHTAVATQCIFCNQLMGMVGCTKRIAGAPPKLYKLRRNKVATLHKGNFTLALTCKLKTPDSAIVRKLENLYRVFAFYHCSIAKVRQISGSHENFLDNMAAIWDFYVPHVRRYGNAVPAMFEPIPTVKLSKGGNVLFLRCSHLLQWLKSQHSLLAGCILYKRSVLCTQLTPELTSHLLLIKPNQLHHPSKSVTDTVLPFGVRIMSVYVTKQQYDQLSKPLPVLTQPRKLAQAKPETIFCTPPASPTDKQSDEAQAFMSSMSTKPKRTFKREISTTAGRLFSNFTGMLECNVVESLWPSSSKPRSSSRSEPVTDGVAGEILVDGRPKLTRDDSDDEVTLSRSSEDVVRTLESQEVPGELKSTGIPFCSGVITDSQDASNRLNPSPNPSPGHSISDASSDTQHWQKREIPLSLSGVSCNDSSQSSAPPDADLGYSESDILPFPAASEDSLERKTDLSYEELAKMESEQESDRLQLNKENKFKPNPAAIISMETEKVVVHEQRKDAEGDTLLERMDSLRRPKKCQNNLDISEPKSESPESGIGDCAVIRRQEALNEPKLPGKLAVSAEKIQEKSVERQDGSELNCVNGGPNHEIIERSNPEITLCGNEKSEYNEVLPVSRDLPNIDDVQVGENHNSVDTNLLLNGFDSTCLNSSQLPTKNNLDNFSPNHFESVNSENKAIMNEENSQRLIDVANLWHKDERSFLIECEADRSNPDILQNSTKELRISPDVLKSAPRNGMEIHGEASESPCNFQNGLIFTKEEGDLQKLASSKDENNQDGHKSCRHDHNANNKVVLEPTSEHESIGVYTQDLEFQVLERFQGNVSLDHTLEDGESTINADRTSISPSSEAKPTRTEDFPDRDKLENSRAVEGSSEMNISNNLGRHHLAPDEERKMESLRLKHNENMGQDSGEAFGLGSPRGDKERSEGPVLEAHSVAVNSNSEQPQEDLVNVSMYVQAHSDTTLLFLAEKSLSKEKDTLYHLWQSILKELGELELHLKNIVKPERELDCKGAFNFVHYDNQHRSLEGSLTNPINQAESLFCRACEVTHEQFVCEESLTEITLRNHQTVVYAHRNACHHTFFHRNVKTIPVPGIPSRDDSGFYIQESCHDVIREHNINLL